MTDLETELVQAQIELAEARKIFEENPAWGRNKKALRAAEKKVAEAKLAFESRQGEIFDRTRRSRGRLARGRKSGRLKRGMGIDRLSAGLCRFPRAG